MNVTIFGSGYVGLVSGACLADVGYKIVCVDIDRERLARLQVGDCPIFEPGLEEMLRRNTALGRLTFTDDVAAAIRHGRYLFIAVGTDSDENGGANLGSVLEVARSIGEHLDGPRVIINKSTAPAGTLDRIRATIQQELDRRGAAIRFSIASNPEFLREGAAIDDFMQPNRIVIGCDTAETAEALQALYAPFDSDHERIFLMDVRSAELTKYAANAMLATRISFMNELANIAERVGADIEQVRRGIGADARIGAAYLYPGAGYGGSCIPKDLRALDRLAQEKGYQATLLQAVEAVNNRQKQRLFEKILTHFDGDLSGRTFALWGLAFKPNTDDLREAPSRELMQGLWQAGARVRAFDPEAHPVARQLYGDRDDLELCPSPEAALHGSDALIIVTEWGLFRNPDFTTIRKRLRQPLIFDGRNLFDPHKLKREGFVYYGIGRGEQGPP